MDNNALRPIVKEAPAVTKVNEKGAGSMLNLGDLLFNGESQVSFAHYIGSLTTPGCNEAVLWNVKMSPVEISSQQASHF